MGDLQSCSRCHASATMSILPPFFTAIVTISGENGVPPGRGREISTRWDVSVVTNLGAGKEDGGGARRERAVTDSDFVRAGGEGVDGVEGRAALLLMESALLRDWLGSGEGEERVRIAWSEGRAWRGVRGDGREGEGEEPVLEMRQGSMAGFWYGEVLRLTSVTRGGRRKEAEAADLAIAADDGKRTLSIASSGLLWFGDSCVLCTGALIGAPGGF